ncbi:phage integrase family protein [Collimonas arenae]|uniref:Phage integrase family protein n=1 Tax=Collimonas arenae TaxID=279058 RepID=A0A127PMH9_9BURK|nr:site-specific integrase [Collimonas arenae]AMO99010.1 phage integrase family protein [Collimonas arenae]AMP08905.1 phage integrase family protein [Collimonas arenae]
MASIVKIGTSWRALIRRKGHKGLCKTFQTKAQAEAWARQREAEIDRGEIVAEPGILRMNEVIQSYRDLRDHSRPVTDTSNEHYMLRRLSEGLGDKRAGALSNQDLVSYCKMRKEEGAGPYTINMEISKLGTVMRYTGSFLKIALPDVTGQARPLLNHLGLIGGGGKRERRPTEDEIAGLLQQLKQPYSDIVRFAIATAMRRGEIVKLQWSDLDPDKKLALVRDRKDPRKKQGNDQWVPLLGEAWDIVQSQSRDDDRIFPVHEQTMSKYFKEACDTLGIPDLHFHDLRHEGTSRLFEEGYEIQQVSLVTGHKDWRHLRRYTNLKPEDLHRPEKAAEILS